jgi:PKD repeat protein
MKNLIGLLILQFIALSSFSQRTINGNETSVRNENNLLIFNSQSDFETVFNNLSKSVVEYDYSKLPDEQPTDRFVDPMPPLAEFEKSKNFKSWRLKAELEVFNSMIKGKEMDIDEVLFEGDEILASLISEDRMIQIGKEMFYFASPEFYYSFDMTKSDAIRLIRNGYSPLTIPGMKLIGGNYTEFSCSANFMPNGFTNTLSGTFIYNGTPSINEITSMQWSFGDGNSSNQFNPSHTYLAYGTYQVCLEIRTKDNCTSQFCREVVVQQNVKCTAAFIFNETGNPGEVFFNNQSTTSEGTITSWQWSFGDGGTSNQQHPVHKFPCDKEYLVTLTIRTSTGCTSNLTFPVVVTSYNCCEKRAKVEGWKYYSNDQFRYHYKTRHVHLPFAKYVHSGVRHSKKGFLGLYWWKKANLSVTTTGNVYTVDEKGCFCQTPFSISGTKSNNTSWLVWDINVNNSLLKPFKAKLSDPWNVRYTANSDATFKVLQVTCD